MRISDWSSDVCSSDLAKAQDLAGKREALFAGKPVNVTEDRAAEHGAERGEGAEDAVARAAALHARMRALIDAIEGGALGPIRSEDHTSELQSLMRNSYAVFCLKKKTTQRTSR